MSRDLKSLMRASFEESCEKRSGKKIMRLGWFQLVEVPPGRGGEAV